MLLPPNPEISLDPHGEAELHGVVPPRVAAVLVGAVHGEAHLEGGHILQEVDRWLQQNSERHL